MQNADELAPLPRCAFAELSWIYSSSNLGGASPRGPGGSPRSGGVSDFSSGAPSGFAPTPEPRGGARATAEARATAALCSAAYFGTVAGVESAIEAGGCVSGQDETGMTPLHWAAHGGHEEVAQVLLQRGADACAGNAEGWTPLHYAACAGHQTVATLLLRCGADGAATNHAGRTPLQMAKDSGMESLLRRGAAPASVAAYE